MATQGPNGTGTAADDAGTGTVAWSSPTQAQSDDATPTTASLGSFARSHYLKCTNFGFSIPDGSTIDGITAEHKRSCNAGTIVTNDAGGFNIVNLLKAGSIAGTGQSDPLGWPTTAAFISFGGASSLW